MLTSNGCDLKTFPNLLKAVKINSRAIKAEKISFVNFVTCFTNVDPWNAATVKDKTNNQMPIHTRQAKKSISLPIKKEKINENIQSDI